MFQDRIGKTNGKLSHGLCAKNCTLTIPKPIDSQEYWMSFVTNDVFEIMNINGSNLNAMSYFVGIFSYTEDGVELFAFDRPFTSHSRIILYRNSRELRFYVDNQILASSRIDTVMPGGTLDLNLEFSGVLYDLRFGNGVPFLNITDSYTNETAMFPIQEGASDVAYNVINQLSNGSFSSVDWVTERERFFYNQVFDFIPGINGERVPKSYWGRSSEYIIDDGETWFDFSQTGNNYFNKKAIENNTLGFPEFFNETIILSEFYYKNIHEDNYFLWNIQELFRIVFETYLFKPDEYTYLSKRKLNTADFPVGLSTILLYNRKLSEYEIDSICAYWKNDDRSDDPNKYKIPVIADYPYVLIEHEYFSLDSNMLLTYD